MRVLIAGFGNLLLGDDGFGPTVVRRLAAAQLPAHVETLEAGTGGLNLVIQLMQGFDKVIVVDAVQRGGVPGTLYEFEPSPADLSPKRNERLDPHTAEPASAMRLASQLKLLPAKVTVIGCEPSAVELSLSLSAPVEGAVERAAARIREMVSHDAG